MQHRATFAHTCTSRIAYPGIVWALLANFAHAQDSTIEQVPSSAPAIVSATALGAEDFQRGLGALKAGQHRQAIAAFKAAYERDQSPASLLNIGIAYTNLGQPHDAVQALESYITHSDAVRDAESISSVRAEIERLRNSSGRIGVHLIPEHADVQLDGEPITLQGGELLAAPGKRHISARADGYKLFEQTLDVQAGQFTLEIQLQKIVASPVAAAIAAPAVAEPVAAKAATATAPQTEPTDEPEASAASSCALDQVCMGPVVSLLGPPNLIGGGLHARIGRYLGLGVDYQVLPTLNFNPISIGTSLVSANARVYPFGGAFFLGGGIGYQTIRGQLRQDEIGVTAKAGFPAAMASIGFMGHDGFILGADLGLLFPLGSIRASVQENTGRLAQAGIPQSDIDDAREKAETEVNKVLGALPLLVQVNLIRVGYMF